MARKAELGWPMVRERIGSLCGRIAGALAKPALAEWGGSEMTSRSVELIFDRTGKMRKQVKAG